MMELPLVLSVYHFWVGFQPIFKVRVFPLCILHYEIKLKLKNKGRVFRTSLTNRDLTKTEKWAKIVSKT